MKSKNHAHGAHPLRKSMRVVTVFILAACLQLPLSAQFSTIQLNQAERAWYENNLLRSEHNLHTAILPWRTTEVSPYSRKSELLPDTITKAPGFNNWFYRKAFQEDLFFFQGKDYWLTINPAVAFEYGKESESSDYETTYRNSRGLRIEGQLGKCFTFYTSLVESQARFAAHVNQLAGSNDVVPGYWLAKTFRDDAYDFAYASGEIGYDAGKFFHFRLGRGKQFIGEGYRSMLMSDNSVNYPFFRIETTVGKVKYVNLWAVMSDLRPEVALADDVYAKKYLSMHYLSINIGRRWNLGLFEGMMWGDELNRYGFDANFLNPVILYRPVEFAQGFTGGNILMGINTSYQLPGGLKVYGQVAIDEFLFEEIRNWSNGSWLNMMAWQAGVKWGDALGIRNLFLRAEYNAARPYTYAHREVLTNWGHYSQPLAHPLGANFSELLLHAQYRRGRWQGQLAIHTAALGRDENKEANWGGDIFKPFNERSANNDVFIGNGVPSDLLYWRAEVSYLANPLYNLRLQLGVQHRSEDEPAIGLPNSQIWYMGLKTDMYDLYQDYQKIVTPMKFNSQNSILGANPIAGYVTKLFIFGVDMVYALIAITTALLLTGNFAWERLNLLLTWGPVLLLFFRGLSFFLFKTYLLIVRYVGEKDYKNVFYATSLSSVVFFLLLKFLATPFNSQEVLPIVLVDYFVLLLLSGGTRIVLRLLFDRLRLQGVNRLNTVVFGAGELGAMLHHVLKQNTTHNYRVVAFFDDNQRVHKKYLNGVRIYNPEKSFAAVIKKLNIKYAIIGINGLLESRRVAFINDCLEHQVKVLKVPPTESWLNNDLNLGQLVNIKFEDLLSRPPIQLNQDGIRESIADKVVLVTGCAGSIGSEIVRQLLPYQPKKLIGLDQAETPLADLGLSLKEEVSSGVFVPIIGDVRDRKKLGQIFTKYEPAYVFHAAAYKHVPIMELFPTEAIFTNVQGTINLADLSVRHHVEKFVMVSTDKAVNPSNVMGASKRIAEIYVQALSGLGDHVTQFITTRFGNVLGSNGSVIPIFKGQIEKGLPVTVTHPEVTRFFMTIPEACQLVLEAGAMGQGGEIFIFDMGEPVKIVDLARRMIQMAGLVPNVDIEIHFTGLRPGEKLYEELLDGEEGLIPTHHPKIQKAAVRSNDYNFIQQEMEELIKLSNTDNHVALVAKMKEIVPEFTSKNSVFSRLDEQISIKK